MSDFINVHVLYVDIIRVSTSLNQLTAPLMTEQLDLEIFLLLPSNVGGNADPINCQGRLLEYEGLTVIRDGDVHGHTGVVGGVFVHEQGCL